MDHLTIGVWGFAFALGGVASGASLLLWSGALHVRDTDALRAVIVTHRVLPYRHSRQVATLLTIAEITVGFIALGAVAVATLAQALLMVASILVALQYAAFAVYMVFAIRRSPHASCGCFDSGASLTHALVARAGAISAASGCAAWMAASNASDLTRATTPIAMSIAVVFTLFQRSRYLVGRRSALAGSL